MQRLKMNIDFSRYKGKYVAMVGERVVASGEKADKVLAEARSKYPGKQVVLRKIPEEETLIFAVSDQPSHFLAESWTGLPR